MRSLKYGGQAIWRLNWSCSRSASLLAMQGQFTHYTLSDDTKLPERSMGTGSFNFGTITANSAYGPDIRDDVLLISELHQPPQQRYVYHYCANFSPLSQFINEFPTPLPLSSQPHMPAKANCR